MTALNRTRKRLPFALCGYCLMPGHIHVIIFPEESTSISNVIKSFKLTTIELFRRSGHRDSRFWPSRFYDQAPERRMTKP
ncbi:MAG: transposase [Acidobacteria bacterium]|nr:transposase [Acidobacteriota bacterium]